MPFVISTLPDLRRSSRDFITAQLPGSELAPPNSRLRVLSDKNAATGYLNLLYLLWISEQLMPDTAETEWLDRHGDIWLPGGRKDATFASGVVNVTGTNGTILPNGTRMAVGDVEYQTTQQITVGTGDTPVTVAALTAGIVGNQVPGSALGFVDVVAGVNNTATVVSLVGGVDVESDELLRGRVLARIQQPPMGGDAADYVAWALEVPGVTRAWCSPREMGMGTVTVRFMMDELRATSSSDTDGFPLAGDITTVAAHIDLMRPVAVKDFFVVAPIPESINFVVYNLNPDDAATRAAISASVAAMINERAAPGYALNGVPQEAQTIYAAWVSEAIMQAAGVISFDLPMVDHEMPSNGNIAVIGTISYAIS